MGLQRPSPTTVAGLCEKYGDESRLPLLKDIEKNGSKAVVSAPAEPAVAGVTPSSAASVAPPVDISPATEAVQPEAIRPAVPAPAAAAVPPPAAAAASSGPLVKPTPSSGKVSEPKFPPEEATQLAEPIPFAQYSAAHERALEYMRWRRDDAVAKDAALAPSAEMASDYRLMRFLIAKQFDCGGAADMYVASLRWRSESGMDKTRAKLIEANRAFFTEGAAHLDKIMLHAADAACHAAYPRMYTKAQGESGSSGGGSGPHELLFDKHGNVIYIECPGIVHMPDLVPVGLADFSAYVQTTQELVQLVLDELSRRSGKLILCLRVLDMKEITLVKMFQSSAEKAGEKIVKDAGKPLADNYPSTTYKNYLINLPAANVAAPIVKNFAPARSAKKMVMLGSKYFDEIRKEAEPGMLPKKLGGTLSDGVQWEKKKK